MKDNRRLNDDVRLLNKNYADVNNNLQGISDFVDDFRQKHEQNVKDVKFAKVSISKVRNDLDDQAVEHRQEIKSALSDIKEENDELKSTVLDLQCRSMKNNLVFTGLIEKENENTENVIRDFIRDQLRITHWIELGNVHRFGNGALPGKRGRPRPIVARFIFHNDHTRVLSNTYRLKGKPYGVNQQFPDVIEQARKSLYPIMKQKRAEGCHVKLVRDILYVNGQVYNDSIDNDSVAQLPIEQSQFRTPNNRPGNKRRSISSTPNK